MNTPKNAESRAAHNSTETAPETRAASSPQTSDPPPTPEEQDPHQKNTTMSTPASTEPGAGPKPSETTSTAGVTAPAQNPSGPPKESEPNQQQEKSVMNTPPQTDRQPLDLCGTGVYAFGTPLVTILVTSCHHPKSAIRASKPAMRIESK